MFVPIIERTYGITDINTLILRKIKLVFLRFIFHMHPDFFVLNREY